LSFIFTERGKCQRAGDSRKGNGKREGKEGNGITCDSFYRTDIFQAANALNRRCKIANHTFKKWW